MRVLYNKRKTNNKRRTAIKYILAGLRMYGDMLAECIADPTLTPEEREGFEKDSTEVERLIKAYEYRVENPFVLTD